MYLYVEFVDSWGAYNDSMMGFSTNNRRRIKKIKLTEDQIKELKPKYVGESGNQKIYEQINVLSIQED